MKLNPAFPVSLASILSKTDGLVMTLFYFHGTNEKLALAIENEQIPRRRVINRDFCIFDIYFIIINPIISFIFLF